MGSRRQMLHLTNGVSGKQEYNIVLVGALGVGKSGGCECRTPWSPHLRCKWPNTGTHWPLGVRRALSFLEVTLFWHSLETFLCCQNYFVLSRFTLLERLRNLVFILINGRWPRQYASMLKLYIFSGCAPTYALALCIHMDWDKVGVEFGGNIWSILNVQAHHQDT